MVCLPAIVCARSRCHRWYSFGRMRARAASHSSICESCAAAQDRVAGTALRTGSNISQCLALRAAVLRRAVSQWTWGRCHASGNAQVPPRRPVALCSLSAKPRRSRLRSRPCASSSSALTLPSKGRPTAGHTGSLRHGQPRRWPPLMSNVRRLTTSVSLWHPANHPRHRGALVPSHRLWPANRTSVSARQARRGFGSSALQVGGKIFAMVSSNGSFVVKLPKQRVEQLEASGVGQRFDPGHGRLMKEWLALDPSSNEDWLSLAREALRFVASKS